MNRTMIALAATVALLAPAAPAVANEVPPMTVDVASARYLAYVCPANAAAAKYNRAVNRYDRRDELGDRVHKKTRAAAKKMSTRTRQAARAFTDPAFPWPVDIAGDIQAIAVGYYQQAATAKRISKARHRWSAADFDWLDLSYEAATVRLFLELPPAGEGC